MSQAARLGDPIEHTGSLTGLLAGLAIGAIGAALIVGTGGLAAVAIVGASATAGAGIGQLIGSLSVCDHSTGQIQSGSANVFINGKPAARAHLDTALCDEHGPAPQVLAQGSDTVYINGVPAARVGDRTVCDAKISSGSGNVVIGGGTQTTDSIRPEVPEWLERSLLVVGLGSALVLASPIVVAAGLVGGIAGGAAGHWAGGKLFGAGSDGQKLMTFGAGLLGGGLGAKGGKWFDARYEIKTQGLGSNFGNVKIQRREISLDSTEKVTTHKLPHTPLGRYQRKALKRKLDSRTITKEEYARLDWDRRFSNKKTKGIARFWAQERLSLKAGNEGTRNWSQEQKAAILDYKKPTFNGEPIQGHHRYNASAHPHLASDPKNIYPATRTEHLKRWHGGSWRNDSFGEPVNPSFLEEF
ncbi:MULTISPECIES: PAAR domain-containing protein [Pseudomonas]|uniref:Rhs family protein n=1 Tax=Pseudomonas quercus TaxID=2722792 RepID=A0ABX0YGB4_9PSED|nr:MULTISPECIES: PAAR domain-containing protein [Pseudomonas]MBF7142696.1 PAAR domain-containing protein [Pseudomonas sp. LY10J]NJP01234.1 Rhs family protein [Pseudomonas quercus]